MQSFERLILTKVKLRKYKWVAIKHSPNPKKSQDDSFANLFRSEIQHYG